MAEDARHEGGDLAAQMAVAGGSEEARDYLRRQSRLTDLQIADLEREDSLRHWSLRVHHISDVLKLAFEFAVAAIVLGILALLTGAVWSAAHENGLVIEAFSVPPDMAAKGLTGQAVAAQLQDKLSAMQVATVSARPAASYSNNWGNDIKVEIPNTGVSISEFYRYLVSAFGHQTHITGEVYRTTNGIAITARASGDGGATATGVEDKLDALLQQTAENIYGRTQPYRYAVYVSNVLNNATKGARLYENLIATGDPRERKWAHIGLGVSALFKGDNQTAAIEHRETVAEAPDFGLGLLDLDFDEGALGHDEAALMAERNAIRIEQSGHDTDISDQAKPSFLLLSQINETFSLSDYNAGLAFVQSMFEIPDYDNSWESGRQAKLGLSGLLHDSRGLRDYARNLPPPKTALDHANRDGSAEAAAYWIGDWQAVVSLDAAFEAIFRGIAGNSSALRDLLSRSSWPYEATALAHMGNLKAAHALIDKTPRDCYTCIRNRADIAAIEKRWDAADYWFAMAVAQAPSIPMAYWDWGRVLLLHGDANSAIAKFKLSSEKGPHFADPLEGWGEALMAQNRSDLALAKFEAANKEAPKWARLHLKWGEALYWSGDHDGAARQFAVARQLDLTPSEKSELAKVMHG